MTLPIGSFMVSTPEENLQDIILSIKNDVRYIRNYTLVKLMSTDWQSLPDEWSRFKHRIRMIGIASILLFKHINDVLTLSAQSISNERIRLDESIFSNFADDVQSVDILKEKQQIVTKLTNDFTNIVDSLPKNHDLFKVLNTSIFLLQTVMYMLTENKEFFSFIHILELSKRIHNICLNSYYLRLYFQRFL